MFERYTKTAKRVLFAAAFEAAQNNSSAISAEHILLGLTYPGGTELHEVLGLENMAQGLREHLHAAQPKPPYRKVSPGKIPLGESGKEVVLFAADEARIDALYWIDSGHLARALLRFPNPAEEALLKAGFTLEGLRSSLSDYRLRVPPPLPPPIVRRLWYSLAQYPNLLRWAGMMGLLALLAAVLLLILRIRGPL